jgi:hypothetical protein
MDDLKRIEQSDVSDLQGIGVRKNQLLMELGAIVAQRRMLEADESEKFAQIEQLNREQNFHYNRIMRKYDLPENTVIDITNGDIVK